MGLIDYYCDQISSDAEVPQFPNGVDNCEAFKNDIKDGTVPINELVTRLDALFGVHFVLDNRGEIIKVY